MVKFKLTKTFKLNESGMIYSIMVINRRLKADELNEIYEICKAEVEKNRIAQNGAYFRSCYRQSAQLKNFINNYSIYAVGAYFDNRLLFSYEDVNDLKNRPNFIYLDDHSGPENNNNACAIAIQKYLLEKGAMIVL